MSGIFLQGLNQVVTEFEAETQLAPIRARAVVQKHSARIKDTMKSFEPVDEGTMRDSTTYETRQLVHGAVGEVGPTATRDGFPYPAAVEWGTSKMAPQAFAGPALDRHSGDFVKDVALHVSGL